MSETDDHIANEHDPITFEPIRTLSTARMFCFRRHHRTYACDLVPLLTHFTRYTTPDTILTARYPVTHTHPTFDELERLYHQGERWLSDASSIANARKSLYNDVQVCLNTLRSLLDTAQRGFCEHCHEQTIMMHAREMWLRLRSDPSLLVSIIRRVEKSTPHKALKRKRIYDRDDDAYQNDTQLTSRCYDVEEMTTRHFDGCKHSASKACVLLESLARTIDDARVRVDASMMSPSAVF